jgi:hypothetical protein
MSQILRRYSAHADTIADAQKLGRILLETGSSAPVKLAPGVAGGDNRALRGIPAIGRNCPGHIRDTDPGGQLIRRSR